MFDEVNRRAKPERALRSAQRAVDGGGDGATRKEKIAERQALEEKSSGKIGSL